MDTGPRLLFVHNYPMRFVNLDLALLRDQYRVTELYLPVRKIKPASIFAQVGQHDLVFAWFASLHSLIPLLCARLLKRPSLLVVGGYDLARLPDAGYGHQRGGVRKWLARGAMHFATRLIAISCYSREEAVKNAGVERGKISVVHLSLDPAAFSLQVAKESLVVTVGNVYRENLVRKGLEAFVQTARQLPEVPFVLIGRWYDGADHLRRIAPDNVILTGYLPDAGLVEHLRRAKVYVQASAHEGFGMAVAEAMLCGCIPVVTRAGALPEVVGETGVYLASAAPEHIAAGVRAALQLGADHSRQARERIIQEFPLEKRRRGLFQLIDGLLARGAA